MVITCHIPVIQEIPRGFGSLCQELGDMHKTVLIMPHYDFQEILHWVLVVLLFLRKAFGPHLCAAATNTSQIVVSGVKYALS